MATAELLQQEVTPASDAERALYPLSVEQYHCMIEAGILTKYDKCELLEGQLLMMSPIGSGHAVGMSKSQKQLIRLCGGDWYVRSQLPITLQTSEPQPDISVARGQDDDYAHRHPRVDDLGLVAEVSDSSLSFDRKRKGKIYAKAGIDEYWIINLIDRCIEVYRDPKKGKYQTCTVFAEGETVPLVLDGQALRKLNVADLLPIP